MELMVRNGDYVNDGAGGFLRRKGRTSCCSRCCGSCPSRGGAFRCCLRWAVSSTGSAGPSPLSGPDWPGQYVAQALSDEAELSVAGVELSAGGELTVELDWRGEALRLILGTGGV